MSRIFPIPDNNNSAKSFNGFLSSKHGILKSKCNSPLMNSKSSSHDTLNLTSSSTSKATATISESCACKNSDEIKLISCQIIKDNQKFKQRISEDFDELSHSCSSSIKMVSAIREKTKRKIEEMDHVIKDVDSDVEKLDEIVKKLQGKVHDLNIRLDSLQTKRRKGDALVSAAVGVATAVCVVAGVVLGPEWTV